MKYARDVLLAALILFTVALILLTVNVLAAGALAVSKILLAFSIAAAVAVPICFYFLPPPTGGPGGRRAI